MGINPFIIAIAGGSASGKTMLCSKIKDLFDNFKVIDIHTDNYFKEQLPKIKSAFSDNIYDDYNHPSSIDFEKFESDFKNIIYESEYDICIIEGLLTLSFTNMLSDYDLTIYIDTPSGIRFARRVKRIGANYLPSNWNIETETDYFNGTVNIRHSQYVEITRWNADIVINGVNINEKALEMIKLYVNKNIE